MPAAGRTLNLESSERGRQRSEQSLRAAQMSESGAEPTEQVSAWK